jgi:hypothetical protein
MLNRNIAGMLAISLMEAAIADGAAGGAPAEATKPGAEKVKMEDGREVEFVGKRRMLKDSIFADGTGHPTIRLDFRNGRTVSFKIPEALVLKFAAHGAEQKLGDEVAGYKEDELDDQVLAVEDLVKRLEKGEWNVKREGGAMAGTSILIKALVEFAAGSRTAEQVKEFLSGKSQAEKVALKNSPKIKPIVEKLEAERAAKTAHVDTDALLAGLA